MQHKLITETATFSAPHHYRPARPVRETVAIPATNNWRVTFAVAAATFVGVFAVVAFVL